MRLRFIRLDCDVLVSERHTATLEIHDRTLFARIVRSMMSGQGRYADEPYTISSDGGKDLNPRNALMVINTLPVLPLTDRTLLSRLYKRVSQQLESDSRSYVHVHELVSELEGEISSVTDHLWGDYHLASEWELEAYLKTFKLLPSTVEDATLLDSCIGFIDFCVDVASDVPLVFVNAKSFFSTQELNELVDHAVFSGISLVFIESWKSDQTIENEQKTVLDQHFIVL